jgi:hypothetical protein
MRTVTCMFTCVYVRIRRPEWRWRERTFWDANVRRAWKDVVGDPNKVGTSGGGVRSAVEIVVPVNAVQRWASSRRDMGI